MTSRHDICETARKAEPCNFCHADPGQACVTDMPGVHLCRVCLAVADHLLTMLDEVSCIHDRDVYTGADLVLDEGSAAA